MRNVTRGLLYLLRLALAGAVGVIGGWGLTMGLCSRWFVGFSVICGHNAYIPLYLLVAIACAIGWFILAPVTRTRKPKVAGRPQDAA